MIGNYLELTILILFTSEVNALLREDYQSIIVLLFVDPQ